MGDRVTHARIAARKLYARSMKQATLGILSLLSTIGWFVVVGTAGTALHLNDSTTKCISAAVSTQDTDQLIRNLQSSCAHMEHDARVGKKVLEAALGN